MARSSRPPLSRSEKWLLYGVTLLVFTIVGAGGFKAWLDSAPNYLIPPPHPLPKPNGYDYYVSAANAITLARPAVDEINDPNPPPTAKLRAARYSLARRRAWIQANAIGFARFDQALKMPCLHPDRVWMFPELARIRTMARYQIIRVNTYKLEGYWNEATQGALDVIQMGVDFPRGGSILPRIVGVAITGMGARPLSGFDHVPAHLTGSQARAAAKRIEALIARLPPFDQSLETTRLDTLNEMMRMAKKANWREIALRQPSLFDPGSFDQSTLTTRQKLAIKVVSKRRVLENINANFEGAIADSRKSYSASSDPRLDTKELDTITQLYTISKTTRTYDAFQRVQLRLLLLRFALRAYYAEHSTYPSKLTQLAPTYLKRVPTDAFADDKPFHYHVRNEGKAYKLWSIGPDGVDDGGRAIVTEQYHPPPGSSPEPNPVYLNAPLPKGDWVARLNR